MEQCYRMLASDAGNVDPAERALMLDGAQSYLVAIIDHILGRSLIQSHDPSHGIVLVGHDPNIGGLQQHLEPRASLSQLAPLQGITIVRRFPELMIEYSFGHEILGHIIGCLRYSPDRSNIRRVI